MSEGIGGFSDNELAELLDKALEEGRVDECWMPLMREALSAKRDIPHRHLAKAVKVFNRRRHETLFHIAVYRYLADLAGGRGEYRAQDRRLLETYSSYLINNAGSSSDENLRQAMLLCRKLDRDLYAQLFE